MSRSHWEQEILQSKSREILAKSAASQEIYDQMPSTWPAHEENVSHRISEPDSKQENFERAQMIGRSKAPPLQS
ncbi:hypothetical protein Golomagni_02637 [Golovinomyces magnicellulatus]|nr:hypothetical protein Golomagni_02637 [Golovinomyces magnicellulatus]